MSVQRTRFEDLLSGLANLHARKNADYGDEGQYANLYAVRALGLSPFVGVLVRMNDKMARINAITRQGICQVSEETVQDTLRDLAVYALLAIILYEEEQATESADSTTRTSR